MLTLFLETMQDEDRFLELHGIHRSIGAAPVVFDHLKHTRAAETFEHLRVIMLIAGLSQRQRVPKESPTGNRMAELILQSTINIKPTLYKNQGDRGTIFVARDLDFSTVYELQPH